MSIKCHNLHLFKEMVIMLYQNVLEMRQISQLHGSALYAMTLNEIKNLPASHYCSILVLRHFQLKKDAFHQLKRFLFI